MRIFFIAIIFMLCACRSDTGLRTLEVRTQVEIKLPPDAVYGNISSFSGFHAAVPDLFVEESVEKIDGQLSRILILLDHTVLTEELIETNDDKRLIKYKTTSTTLPVNELIHTIEIKELGAQICQVVWVSNMSVQNQYRDDINERITGIQESYLFSLELLGEELDELLQNPDF